MFDPKISAVAAGAAFILSFLIGLLSGAGFVFVLVRALIFAAIFFILTSVAYWLITQFIPELMNTSAPGAEAAIDEALGQNVDLSVDDEQELSYKAGYDTVTDSEEEVPDSILENRKNNQDDTILGTGDMETPDDDASGTFSSPLDQNGIEGYTEKDMSESEYSGASPALPLDVTEDVDALPDLESMSDSFISPIGEESENDDDKHESVSLYSGTKTSGGPDGAFDPREMASAIQTILKRDQKG